MPEEHVTDIERDLAALLDIEPSPQFGPRLRVRIAEAPAPRPWARWALAAAAIVLVATGWLTMRAVTEEEQPAGGSTSGSTLVRSTGAPAGAATPTFARRRLPKPFGEARVARSTNAPEVIVDLALSLAVQRLMRDPGHARPDIATPAAVTTDGRPVDLAVAPMAVDDLAVPDIAVGDPQFGARR